MMKTPPKDKTIIATFEGYPWETIAIWNPVDNKWVYVTSQCGMVNGEWNDWYFENETADEDELISWRSLLNGKNDEVKFAHKRRG